MFVSASTPKDVQCLQQRNHLMKYRDEIRYFFLLVFFRYMIIIIIVSFFRHFGFESNHSHVPLIVPIYTEFKVSNGERATNIPFKYLQSNDKREGKKMFDSLVAKKKLQTKY